MSLKCTNSGHLLARKNNLSTKCCGNGNCRPYVLDSTITNSTTNPTWNLASYQGEGIAEGDYWRLKETGAGVVYASGCISEEGELVGLPDSFTTRYAYDGFMEIQIGCYVSDEETTWP